MQALYLTFLILSMAIFLTAIILCLVVNAKTIKSSSKAGKKSAFLTPFNVFLVLLFLAITVLMFPLYYTSYFSEDNFELKYDLVKIIKSIFLSIHNALRLFILDGDFELVREMFTNIKLDVAFSDTFSVYAAVLFVLAPFATAGFVLSFFKNITAPLKKFFYPKADIFVMSELNERSITLATNIINDYHSEVKRRKELLKNNKKNKTLIPQKPTKKLVIFADVFEKDEEESFELVEQAKKIGAICYRKDITSIGLRPSFRDIERKLFFISDDEDENVRQTLSLIKDFTQTNKSKDVYNQQSTHFFVFSNTAESEVLLNSVDNGNICVRRISQPINLALNILATYSIFDTKIERDGEKVIGVVIVGLGGYGTELFKNICWCGQMDGYRLKIHVFDDDADCKRQLSDIAPEIIKYNHIKVDGEPFYDIYFHNNIDVRSQRFLDELSVIDDISATYVMLGDDELNIETAMKIRMQFKRDEQSFGRLEPKIYAVVYSSVKNDTLQAGLKNMKQKDYSITFIGNICDRYSLKYIEQPYLEKSALEVHMTWAEYFCADKREDMNLALEKFESCLEPKEKKMLKGEYESAKKKYNDARKAEEDKYNKYEYFRRSSMAQALHIDYRVLLGKLYFSDIEKGNILEHKRWCAYMRADGYIFGIKKDDIAKTHYDLIPFEKLHDSTKEKDVVYLLKKFNKKIN